MNKYWSKISSNLLPQLPRINPDIAVESHDLEYLSIKIIKNDQSTTTIKACGADLGLRTFLTTFSPSHSIYYQQRQKQIQDNTSIMLLHTIIINHMFDLNDTVFIGSLRLNNFNDFLKINLFNKSLLDIASKRNKNVLLIPEPYTTKTCSRCGYLNNIGSSKIYKCRGCNIIACRDLNAAKNILIKGLMVDKSWK